MAIISLHPSEEVGSVPALHSRYPHTTTCAIEKSVKRSTRLIQSGMLRGR